MYDVTKNMEDKVMKKLGFISWYAIVASTLVTCVFDYSVVQTWSEFGGFSAWLEQNTFADVASAYIVMWHVFAGLVYWLVFICNKD